VIALRLGGPSWPLQPDALDLVLGKPLLGAVVKLGRPRALVRRHFLGVLECAAADAVAKLAIDASRRTRR